MLTGLRVLWIDDDLSVIKYSSAYLSASGVQVDVAVDARRGIGLARQSRFDVIILDLRLQAVWGLDVFKELRATGVASPVMILTGYGETDSALEAGLLGAVAYEHKPLTGARLLAAIQRAAAFDRPSREAPVPFSSEDVPPRPIESLVLMLATGASAPDRDWLITSLARALANPSATLFEFLAVAAGLRLLGEKPALPVPLLAPRIKHLLDTMATLTWDHLDARIGMLVARLEHRGERWTAVKADGFAAEVGVTVATLRIILRESLGLTFEALGQSLVMRRAVPELIDSRAHVRQIAFRLGYSHHSGFCRDFRNFTGTSPRRYRAMLRHVG